MVRRLAQILLPVLAVPAALIIIAGCGGTTPPPDLSGKVEKRVQSIVLAGNSVSCEQTGSAYLCDIKSKYQEQEYLVVSDGHGGWLVSGVDAHVPPPGAAKPKADSR